MGDRWNVWDAGVWRRYRDRQEYGKPLGYRGSRDGALALAGMLASQSGRPVVVSRNWGLFAEARVRPNGTVE